MDEIQPIDLVNDFAKTTNRSIRNFEQTSNFYINKGLQNYSRIAIMDIDADSNCFFVWSNNAKSLAKYDMYSGVFFACNLPANDTFSIRKKFSIDSLNIFKNKKESISGDSFFDKEVIAKGRLSNTTQMLLYTSNLQGVLNKILDMDIRFKIELNTIIPYSFTETNMSWMGIFIPNEWILDEGKIEQLIAISNKLRSFFEN